MHIVYIIMMNIMMCWQDLGSEPQELAITRKWGKGEIGKQGSTIVRTVELHYPPPLSKFFQKLQSDANLQSTESKTMLSSLRFILSKTQNLYRRYTKREILHRRNSIATKFARNLSKGNLIFVACSQQRRQSFSIVQIRQRIQLKTIC